MSSSPPVPGLGRPRWPVWTAWLALGLLLAAGLPLFLRMPLYHDTTLFDLGAKCLLRGGVLYRDYFDNNLPGIHLAHLGIRAVLGWRPEALRAADLVVVGSCLGLLIRLLGLLGLGRAARAWWLVVFAAFYLSTSEVCHCQRDVWMLLPALAAVVLRCRQLAGLLGGTESRRTVIARAAAEGVCWGLAVWIKPFVMVPAGACWALTVLQGRRARTRSSLLLADAGGLLAGGLLIGGAGVAWMVQSGSWPAFREMLVWCRDYYHLANRSLAGRVQFLLGQLVPWNWIHLAAAPLAVMGVLGRLLTRRPEAATRGQEALLGVLYLSWFVQAAFVQYGFVYHFVVPVLLGLAVIAGHRPLAGGSRAARALTWSTAGAFLAVAVVRHPLADARRNSLWARCLAGPATPELLDRLALAPYTEPRSTDWQALDRVAAFLQEQGVRGEDVLCCNFGTNPIYLGLDLTPPTRFGAMVQEGLWVFVSHRDAIHAALAAGPQRFWVTDLRTAEDAALQVVAGADGRLTVEPPFAPGFLKRYPWMGKPVVFHAGPYLVHAESAAEPRNGATPPG